MNRRSWIARARRHRLAIGLIAAYALLLGSMLPAFAAVADPLQATLATHLCGPDAQSRNDQAPAGPAEHQQKCQLCGPSCAMGEHAPIAALSGAIISIAPFAPATSAPHWLLTADAARSSLYPSDAFSQGPPQAA